jgi:hypothetical protein
MYFNIYYYCTNTCVIKILLTTHIRALFILNNTQMEKFLFEEEFEKKTLPHSLQ